MSARGRARARSSWELVVDDTDASDADDQLELEQPYDDNARMADHLLEINEALKGEYWETAVDLCEEALAERPRWSEVRAARDRAASYLEASARGQPTPYFTVIRGALVTYKKKSRDPPDNAQARKSLPDDAVPELFAVRAAGCDE